MKLCTAVQEGCGYKDTLRAHRYFAPLTKYFTVCITYQPPLVITPRSINITISTNKQILHALTHTYKIYNNRNKTRQNNKIHSTNKSRLQGEAILLILCSIDKQYTTLKKISIYVLHESQDSADFRSVRRLLPRHCIPRSMRQLHK